MKFAAFLFVTLIFNNLNHINGGGEDTSSSSSSSSYSGSEYVPSSDSSYSPGISSDESDNYNPRRITDFSVKDLNGKPSAAGNNGVKAKMAYTPGQGTGGRFASSASNRQVMQNMGSIPTVDEMGHQIASANGGGAVPANLFPVNKEVNKGAMNLQDHGIREFVRKNQKMDGSEPEYRAIETFLIREVGEVRPIAIKTVVEGDLTPYFISNPTDLKDKDDIKVSSSAPASPRGASKSRKRPNAGGSTKNGSNGRSRHRTGK